jgi:hypothetical protein
MPESKTSLDYVYAGKGSFLQARLKHVAHAAFRQVRLETRDRHLEQLNRYRFRHQPLAYLQTLEVRWERAACMRVLPPQFK